MITIGRRRTLEESAWHVFEMNMRFPRGFRQPRYGRRQHATDSNLTLVEKLSVLAGLMVEPPRRVGSKRGDLRRERQRLHDAARLQRDT